MTQAIKTEFSRRQNVGRIMITSSMLSMIKQQSKADWIKYEDDYTRYLFRKLATYIYALQDHTRAILEGFDAVTKGMATYYNSLEALFSIPSIKSPGPNGYNSGFFQDSWKQIGNLVCDAVKEIFFHSYRSLETTDRIVGIENKCYQLQEMLGFPTQT
ncbi:LOW QUALITY PROTEIN: hypothetical protein Cgig2_010792 [Carnegiea gigantea]|uniref:Uncharacterized protein n=1 Tax=Carnegiea gigantea TaxID=171969 RepID=A0A9Q1GMV5_9CARY|nr:LOW QUALITY PROTEIN: hypothetical protein Cgig2_010792 [Carnegiea gigantea]